MKELSKDGRLQVAAALHLLRQWKLKDGPGFDRDVLLSIFGLAEHLGVKDEYDDLAIDFPRYRFEEDCR